MPASNSRLLIFGIHRTVDWWRFLGEHCGWGSVVVTDLRGQGDVSIVDDFYAELKRQKRLSAPASTLLDAAAVDEVIARCRTLRWLDRHLASAMVHAMAIALGRVLDRFEPQAVLSFPIDRYVKDVLERLARARNIAYLELTASVVPNMSMLLRRGALVTSREEPCRERMRNTAQELSSPTFVPSYVAGRSRYTRGKFVRTLGYYRLRAAALKAISWLERDPLNLHYLDAQPFLGHKCRWKDIRVVTLCDLQWRAKLDAFPREKRVLFGLQLFPEASIDYWIDNLQLIDHENLVVEAAQAFSDAGYQVLVKDHPLQFGFRHTDVLDRLRTIRNVVLVPYDVGGAELLTLVGVNFTCTGTLGLQAALGGLVSVVTDSYYSNERDFVVFRQRGDVAGLPARVAQASFDMPLPARRERIVEHLLRGSFDGDFFSFKAFDARRPSPQAVQMAAALGRRLDQLQDQGCL